MNELLQLTTEPVAAAFCFDSWGFSNGEMCRARFAMTELGIFLSVPQTMNERMSFFNHRGLKNSSSTPAANNNLTHGGDS
ncbi:unnamed protein product [Linum trigynum]|uniref:Uncharacterized protein n=1 Tax=Linum trigynum TaxID=586398 RepID=A0AAV2D549_9ROSI